MSEERKTIPVVFKNVNLVVHLSADEAFDYTQLEQAITDVRTARKTFGDDALLEKLELLLTSAVYVEKMEVEHVGDRDGKQQSVAPEVPKRVAAPKESLPSGHNYKLQTFPYIGRLIQDVCNEVGEAAVEYLQQSPNTHELDKRMIEEFLTRDVIPF